jgi:hypothetical protein
LSCLYLIGVGVLAVPRHCAARDVEHGVALNWIRLPGAQGCIAAAELSERVERRLERPVFVVDGVALLSVDGAVQPLATGFGVRLALSDRAGRVLGERTLQSADLDCRKLDEALVLVIAVMLYPRGFLNANSGMALDATSTRLLRELFHDEPDQLEPSESVAAAHPAALPATNTLAGAPVDDVTLSTPEPQRSPARGSDLVSASAVGVLAVGYLPAAYFPEQQLRAAHLTSGTSAFGLSQVAAAVCPWQVGRELRAQLCGGLALGLLHVASVGYVHGSIHESDAMLDAQALFDFQWHLFDHTLLQLGAGLALPLIQHSYAYQGLDGRAQPLSRTAQLSGHVALGLGVGF